MTELVKLDIVAIINIILGCAFVIISAINCIVVAVAKTFWKLTFDKKVEEDTKRFSGIDEEIKILKAKAETYDRFQATHSQKIDSLSKMIEDKFSGLATHLSDLKENIKLEVKVAVSEGNNQRVLQP